jgi:hypothetical protein
MLRRNSPSKVYEIFESHPRIKLAFDKCIQECLNSSEAGSKSDSDEASDDDNEEEWDGDALSEVYIHLALEKCQKSVVEAFVRSEAAPREDIELHIAVIAGEPDEDDRTFLALKTPTIAFKFNDRTNGASSSSHSIDVRPASPHAQWLAARILTFLSECGVDMRELERHRPAAVEGWRLSARPRTRPTRAWASSSSQGCASAEPNKTRAAPAAAASSCAGGRSGSGSVCTSLKARRVGAGDEPGGVGRIRVRPAGSDWGYAQGT